MKKLDFSLFLKSLFSPHENVTSKRDDLIAVSNPFPRWSPSCQEGHTESLICLFIGGLKVVKMKYTEPKSYKIPTVPTTVRGDRESEKNILLKS